MAPGLIADYPQRVERIRAELAALPPATKVRLRKKTSNLFRPREPAPGTLDAALFDGVISIDPVAMTADVGGMTTYEHLVEATLAHGLMPLVVPQLKTITLGGAVTGLGIESSSFRNGCPHESVVELDILTGAGEVITARADNEHRELFFAFPNSFGSLGYALRLRIEFEAAPPFVHLRHLRFADVESAVTALGRICADRAHDGEAVDFVDGTWFSADECYLTVAAFADTAANPGGKVSDYTGQAIYYRSIQQRTEDWLTVSDYLWRWDTDWFWCSRAFGAQNAAPAPGVARTVAALGLLLEAHRPQSPRQVRREAGTLARSAGPRGGRAGHRGPDRPGGRVRAVPRPAHRDRTGLALPAAPARSRRHLEPVPARSGDHVRQHRLLVERRPAAR